MDRPADDREAAFWDEHVPPLERCLAAYRAGPDALTAALLDALEPLAGVRVLDFACGAGVVTAWLAARGASVVGLDVSPASVERARELLAAAGVDGARFVVGGVSAIATVGPFDCVCGRFALHHTVVAESAPALAAALRPGGTGAFLETMGTNPMLRAARRVTGRAGIARWGSEDEHPLVRSDLETMRGAFGELRLEVPRVVFFRLLDRQVLRGRSAALARACGAVDDLLGRVGLGRLGYQQLVLVRKIA